MKSSRPLRASPRRTWFPLITTLLTLTACGGGGGGGGGGDSQAQIAAGSLNDAIRDEWAAQGGTQLPAETPVDESITLTPPGSGVMALGPGASVQSQLAFTAPAGTTITGIGIRFGTTGPINVLPLNRANLVLRGPQSGFFHQVTKRAHGKQRPGIGAALDAALSPRGDGSAFPSILGTGSDSCTAIASGDHLSGFGQFPAATVGATNGTLPNACAADDSNRDVWFRWQAPSSGQVVISTCGTVNPAMDPVLTIWNDSSGCPTSSIACDDDSCPSGDLDAQVTFTATANASYLIQISNWTTTTPAWAGTLAITGGGGGGGGGSGTATASFTVPSSVCGNLSSICHQILCQEFAVTSIGRISRANIMQVAVQCGNCNEPSCRQLIGNCNGGGNNPFAGTWSGTWSGRCCENEAVSGTWTFTVSGNGAITGSAASQGISDTITGTVSANGQAAAGSAAGASWRGTFAGTGISGTWADNDPECPCSGGFTGTRQ